MRVGLERVSSAILVAGLIIIAVAIVFRNEGLYPVVFADEFSYSRMARLTSFRDAYIPSYLYLLIYSVTNQCGDAFLSCARLLNAVFFILGSVFVYLVAARFASRPVAIAVALLAVIAPINTYTAYFMPEALFYFTFWLFSWRFLLLNSEGGVAKVIVVAVLFGLLLLIKAHPVFLYPAIILYLGLLFRCWKAWAFTSLVFLLVSIATKLSVGYAIAGKSALTVLGTTYGAIAGDAGGDISKYILLAKSSSISLAGHLMVFFVLFGVVGCALLMNVRAALSLASEESESLKLNVYTVLVILSLIVLSSFFTAAVMNLGPYESLYRLHMRYYNFALPLLLIVAGSRISTQDEGWSWASVGLATVAIGVAGYAIVKGVQNFVPALVDAPDIIGFNLANRAFLLIGAIGMVATVVWAFNQRAGFRIFLFLFAPLMIGLNAVEANKGLRASITPDVHDRAGSLAHALLTPSQRSKAIVFTTSAAGGFRALFHIDNASGRFVTTSPPPVTDIENLLRLDGAAIVIGAGAVVPKGADELKMDGFSIIRRGEFH